MAAGTEVDVGSKLMTIIPDESPQVRDTYDAKQHQNGR